MYCLTGGHNQALERLTDVFYARQYKRQIMLTKEEVDDYTDDVLALVEYAVELKKTIIEVPAMVNIDPTFCSPPGS